MRSSLGAAGGREGVTRFIKVFHLDKFRRVVAMDCSNDYTNCCCYSKKKKKKKKTTTILKGNPGRPVTTWFNHIIELTDRPKK